MAALGDDGDVAPLGAEVDTIPATPRRIHAALQAARARGEWA